MSNKEKEVWKTKQLRIQREIEMWKTTKFIVGLGTVFLTIAVLFRITT